MRTVIGMSVLLAIAATASAQSLADREALDKWQAGVDEETAQHYSQYCGSALKAKLSPDLVAPFAAKQLNAGTYCKDAIGTLVFMCQDKPQAKAAIAQKIKTLTCTQASGDRASFKLGADGNLQVGFAPGTANLRSDLQTYLEKTL